MRAATQLGISDETEGEEVPKAFITGTSDGPIPLTDLDRKEINLTPAEDFVNTVFLNFRTLLTYHRTLNHQSML